MADICATLGVDQDGGVFRIRLPKEKINDLPDAILHLVQTCIRIADLSGFTANRIAARNLHMEAFARWPAERSRTKVVLVSVQ